MRKQPQIFQPASPAAGSADLQVGPLDTGLKIPGWLNRGLAGSGEASMNLLRGAGQRAGLVSKQQIAADQKLDAPLNATTAGKVGNMAGGIVDTLPLMAIPGVNTLAGGALIGGGLGALTPTTNNKQLLANIGIGSLTGGLGTAAGNKLSGMAGRMLTQRAAKATESQALNAERDAVLQQGRQAGLVVPPTAARPNLLNTALESISGKAATRQGAEEINQPGFNALTRRDFGLPANTPLTEQAFQAVRKNAGGVYPQVGKALGTFQSDPQYGADLQHILAGTSDLESKYPGIGAQASQKVEELIKAANVGTHDGDSAVALSKFLRNQAKTNFQSAFRSGSPEAMELAHAQQGTANALEDLIGRQLTKSGQPGLARAWSGARTTIAKAHQAEAALSGNNISARDLAAQLSRGKPVTGGMGTAAQFATHFPEVSRLPKSGVGVSKLAAILGLAGEGGALWMHSPEAMVGGAALAGLPAATRATLLSRLGQRALATPNYRPGMMGTAALKALQVGGRSKALPAVASLLAIPK